MLVIEFPRKNPRESPEIATGADNASPTHNNYGSIYWPIRLLKQQ